MVLQQGVVVAAVSDQHCSQQGFTVGASNQTLVTVLALVTEDEGHGVGAASVGIADGTHVHAQQFQLGAQIGTDELAIVILDLADHGLRHSVTGGYQPVYSTLVQRAFTNGINVRVCGEAVIIHNDAPAFAHREFKLPRKVIAGADACGENNHVCIQDTVVGELHLQSAIIAAGYFSCVFTGVNANIEGFDFAAQHARATIIQLDTHQARCEFNHVSFQTEVLQGVGALQPQQAAADYHADLAVLCPRLDFTQVINGTVGEAALVI